MQPLVGLVVTGGRSARMGSDKSLLSYHGQPQRDHLYRLLEPFCKKLFVSCNKEQVSDIEKKYAFIEDDTDRYGIIGPMTALLSAYDACPGHAFIMIGCDYPFFHKEAITALINSRKDGQAAVAYYNEAVSVYEPLLCLYEADFEALAREHFRRHQYSLQKVLQQATAGKLYPTGSSIIRSVDTVDEYHLALEELKKQ